MSCFQKPNYIKNIALKVAYMCEEAPLSICIFHSICIERIFSRKSLGNFFRWDTPSHGDCGQTIDDIEKGFFCIQLPTKKDQ
jgi:hypothetical protein